MSKHLCGSKIAKEAAHGSWIVSVMSLAGVISAFQPHGTPMFSLLQTNEVNDALRISYCLTSRHAGTM